MIQSCDAQNNVNRMIKNGLQNTQSFILEAKEKQQTSRIVIWRQL